MDRFTIEIMVEALTRGNWGLDICDGDNFYKILFKLEKKDKLSIKDTNVICGSCQRWLDKTTVMIEECRESATRDDMRALEFGEQLKKDILEHVHKILTEMPKENENFVKELVESTKKMD